MRLPILATAALTLAAVLVLLRLSEPPRRQHEDGGVAGTLRMATAYVRQHPRLLSLLTYAAFLSGTAFFVPFVLFQPAMQEQGVAVGWLGVLFTALRLGALVGSRYGPRLIAPDTLATWLLLIPALMIAGFVAVASSQRWWLTLLAMLYLAAVNAAIRPAVTALLNRQVAGSVRATIISLQSLAMTLFIAVLHPAVGTVADATSTAGAFILLAAVCILPGVLAFPLRAMASASPPLAAPLPGMGAGRPEASDEYGQHQTSSNSG